VRVRTEARIDLSAIRSNAAALAERAPGAQLMAVVKADGYGHGLVPSARAAVEGGASWLGTAFLEEALAVRAAGLTVPLLCWLSTPGEDLVPAVQADVDLGVYDPAQLAATVAAASSAGRTARIQLKVDTGLGRGGSTPADWPDLCAQAAEAQASGEVRVTGLWSHLACADAGPGDPVTAGQSRVFAEALEVADRAGLRPEVRHLANSAALLTAPETHYDLVRAGIAVYGLSPVPQLAGRLRAPAGHDAGQHRRPGEAGAGRQRGELLPPLRHRTGDDARAGAARLRRRGAARRHRHRSGAARRGAADRRRDRLHGPVRARRRRRPGRGRRRGAAVRPGDAGEPTAQDWAEALGTINYEVVTRVGARVPRVHLP
jgi:alanine racemase